MHLLYENCGVVLVYCKLISDVYNMQGKVKVGKVAHEPERPTRRSNTGFCYSSVNGMLVHRRVTPSSMSPVTHLYTWVERDKVG